ncbi:hypothetical protein EJ03DRAFT_102050 [Teratosphaeria nubilosa]|uniref:Uncharacterized protein n=1 Tax=Teratosphaeria nubilosa TaxID=161662 RepID=A0A6G1LKY4_9PEZI|nr:hypothetical protein EJ03DRAFT_102050 [Teratosphaeria nubilosa]
MQTLEIKSLTMDIELPIKLVTMIEPEDKATCAAVCLTNKLGHCAAAPLLYGSIGLAKDGIPQGDRLTRMRLLCTLATNRELEMLPSAVKYRLYETSIRRIRPTPDLVQGLQMKTKLVKASSISPPSSLAASRISRSSAKISTYQGCIEACCKTRACRSCAR